MSMIASDTYDDEDDEVDCTSGHCNCTIPHSAIFRASKHRMDNIAFQDILKDATYPQELHERQFETIVKSSTGMDRDRMSLTWTKEKANVLFAFGRYEEAIAYYKDAMKCVLGGNMNFISSEFDNDGYRNALLSRLHYTLSLDLIFCCNKISEAYLRLQNRASALDWLRDLELLYFYQDRFYLNIDDDGREVTDILELCTYRIEAGLRFMQIFNELGNTGTAAYYACCCLVEYPGCFPKNAPEISKLLSPHDLRAFARLKHPELKLVDSWDIVDPDLQVRGTWTKMAPQSRFGPWVKDSCTSWIWKNRMYVLSGAFVRGHKAYMPYHLWYLDLISMKKWHHVSALPFDMEFITFRSKVIVHKNYACFFNGWQDILKFNLKSETWNIAKTECKDWPYLDEMLQNHCVESLNDKMYVYGGFQDKNEATDVLMVLDLVRLKWRQLGTSSRMTPSARTAAGSWIVPEEKRIYVMFGSTTESDLDLEGDGEHAGSPHTTIHNEMWSYSIDTDCWLQESIRGNFPTPREHMGTVYHPGLKSVLAFGGTSDLPTVSAENDDMHRTYYADTFVLRVDSVNSRRWRQIITRHFPTWRYNGRLMVDHATGNTYMFGGYSDAHFLYPTSSNGRYNFIDVWRLDIDLPGSQFTEKEFYSIPPFVKVGPWRRCYSCKRVGKGYFRCQGTCGGRYIFCSVSCQRKAWHMHKRLHGCQKF